MKAKPPKALREKQVLFGLIDLYIESGKPVGSQTLQETGFEHLSSATIRNYFAKLEEEGFLSQAHTSGGRIPTTLGFKSYIDQILKDPQLDPKVEEHICSKLIKETKEVVAYLEEACDFISELIPSAAFLSSMRFDQDFVSDIKLIPLDVTRLLTVIITDFGLVHTEILRIDQKLSHFSIKRIEQFFKFKMTGLDRPELSEEEEFLAKRLYNEVLMRHLVNHVHFSKSNLYKTGFSKLLNHSDFSEITKLSNTMALFENESYLQTILQDAQRTSSFIRYVGEDLNYFINTKEPIASVFALPYFIHQNQAGAFGILIPTRSDYKKILPMLSCIQDCISKTLTKSVYTFKISYRPPTQNPSFIEEKPYEMLKLPLIDLN
jgi:heat-inducible transcriptional repressor